MAFDRWNRQLFVSDLETGMIHRIRLADGADLGFYDHGVQGRANFMDAEAKQQRSLPPLPFNPGSQARIDDCPSGQFQLSPECWNIAPNGRRVWGLGVGRVAAGGEIRLYYSVASSPDLGEAAAWASDDEKRNSVWSGADRPGRRLRVERRRNLSCRISSPSPQDVTRARLQPPVSDITFRSAPTVRSCGRARHPQPRARRGGIRSPRMNRRRCATAASGGV
jgi:hypothetical protein